MDLEIANCDVCNIQASVKRKYYYYNIQCDCCNNKKDNHFEIVRYCSNCEPKPPQRISVVLETI